MPRNPPQTREQRAISFVASTSLLDAANLPRLLAFAFLLRRSSVPSRNVAFARAGHRVPSDE